MDGTDESGRDQPGTAQASLDLDALAVLDYRGWHAFEFAAGHAGEGDARPDKGQALGHVRRGEAAAIHLPLFAAANALYSSAKDPCPRLTALDEAFVGIDERYKPDLFRLAVKFDLDLFITGHDLWVTTATVPMIAHNDLFHDKVTRTTSALSAVGRPAANRRHRPRRRALRHRPRHLPCCPPRPPGAAPDERRRVARRHVHQRQAGRAARGRRAARRTCPGQHPVVYYAQVEPEVAEALRQPGGVAENLARLTGLAVERRAEGVLLADAGGRFTDRPFPGRGGAVNRAASLSWPRSADVLEDPDEQPSLLPLPPEAANQRDLLERIDAALPVKGVVTELAWTAPAEEEAYPDRMSGSVSLAGPSDPSDWGREPRRARPPRCLWERRP